MANDSDSDESILLLIVGIPVLPTTECYAKLKKSVDIYDAMKNERSWATIENRDKVLNGARWKRNANKTPTGNRGQ